MIFEHLAHQNTSLIKSHAGIFNRHTHLNRRKVNVIFVSMVSVNVMLVNTKLVCHFNI